MKTRILILVIVFVNLTLSCFSQESETLNRYLKDSLDVISKRAEKRIIRARYMEQHLVRSTDTLKGWEGVNVSLYKYSVKDPVKGTLTAEVYMLNPDSKKLASWIISTCVAVTNKLDKKNTDLIINAIRSASGGQFPVAGIVYEDMDGKGFKPYYFKDGVTVFLKNSNVTDISEINDANIKSTGKFARIISTTRVQYKNKYGTSQLDGLNWLKLVAQEYKKAMNSNVNTLFIAWAEGQLH